MKKRIPRLTAAVVAASLAVGGVAPVSALAANAPTEEKAVDSSVVTATAHRAASPLPDMLGANTTSGYGMINGGVPDEDEAIGNFALEVWGTSYNENPDPYWWNYYYNFNGGNSSNALLNEDLQGSPVKADTTLYTKYGGLSVSLYTRPDVVIGVSSTSSVYDSEGEYDTSGYDSQLIAIADTGEDYDPELVAYNPTYLDDMITTMENAAAAIEKVAEEENKTTRYDDTPSEIATDYANYIKGIKGYIKHVIGESNYKEIAIVSGVSTDSEGATVYTVQGQGSTSATSTNRYVEYTSDVTTNLTDESYEDVYSSDLAAVGAIIITDADAEEAIKNDAVILAGTKESDDAEALIPEIISVNEMETLYGLSMNSVENALGMGYILARIYDNESEDLNARYVYEYFASKFYHIQLSKVNEIYTTAVVSNITDIGERSNLHITDTDYSSTVETALETLFADNAKYYE